MQGYSLFRYTDKMFEPYTGLRSKEPPYGVVVWGDAPWDVVAAGRGKSLGFGRGLDCVDLRAGDVGAQLRRYRGGVERKSSPCFVAVEETSEHACRLFAVCEPVNREFESWPASDRRHFVVFDYLFESVAVPRPNQLEQERRYWKGEWKRAATGPVPFVEPFRTVRTDHGSYLVTDRDGIYFVRIPADNGGMHRLPTRGGELVHTLIYDHDRGDAAFAFTSIYWFEVKEPFEYHDFDLDPPKPDEPLPTLVRAAREVRRLHPAVMKGRGD